MSANARAPYGGGSQVAQTVNQARPMASGSGTGANGAFGRGVGYNSNSSAGRAASSGSLSAAPAAASAPPPIVGGYAAAVRFGAWHNLYLAHNCSCQN
jgi:hypothetical protein